MTDFQNGYITYVQSDHEDKEPGRDSFILVVEDGENRSPPTSVSVTMFRVLRKIKCPHF